MKRLFTISALLLFSCASAQSPALVWAKNMGRHNFSDYSVAVDASGNVYTTGAFYGTVDFDPGAGIYNLTASVGDNTFISKLDASGNFVWAKALGGSGYADGASIALDDEGNIYVAGQFYGTADFDPGPGTHNLTSAGSGDIFVCKLNTVGDFVWARQMGGASKDGANSIAIDAFGNVYTTGSLFGTGDFDPGAGVYNLPGPVNSSSSTFISKLDASGNFVWAKQLGNYGNTYGRAIKVDRSGNVYTTGSFFYDNNDFDPGPGIYNLTYHGGRDIFISKLDASGNFVWAKDMGGKDFYDDGYAITIDEGGNVYTTGDFSGTVDFDPGPGTYNLTASGTGIFVSKLDASGNFVWAKNMSNPGGGSGTSIATDAAGNVYTTGNFYGTVDFDPGSGIYNVTAANYHTFISKLNSSGNFVFAGDIGRSDSGAALGNSLVLDASGNMYIAGRFWGIVNFSLSPESDLYLDSETGVMFVVKLNQKPYCTIYYRDADRDGFGNPVDSLSGCTPPPGYITNNTDCDDNDNTIHSPVTYYRDLDRDGYGDSYNSISVCSNVPPPGYVTTNYDCYDSGTVSHTEYVRVRMCHDGWTQCVNLKDIPEKLSLGWTLGLCPLQSCAADETLMCHNGKQVCVKTTDVPLLLAQADGKWSRGPLCSGTPISGSTANKIKNAAGPVMELSMPATFKISNYPNPFEGTTTISYELPVDSKVSIKVYDLVGRALITLVDENKKAGIYTVNVHADRLSSGTLYYRIVAKSTDHQFQQTNQMIKIK